MMRKFLEPKSVSWQTRSKAIFMALAIYSLIEFMQLLGIATNPSQEAIRFLASETAVTWRAGLLAILTLVISVSAVAASWSLQSGRLDWHKAHGMITAGLYTFYAVAQIALAGLLTPTQIRIALILSFIYLVFGFFAWTASRKASQNPT
jgi:hypothetical protein